MAEKKDRCWPGYAPVKGKSEHEQGSCRPKAEAKMTPTESKFRTARRKQLDKWGAEHPDTRKSASQHLPAPKVEAKRSAAKKRPTKKNPSR
jgi:hypothetical protein